MLRLVRDSMMGPRQQMKNLAFTARFFLPRPQKQRLCITVCEPVEHYNA